MKKDNNKNRFFGLNTSDKAKVARKAARLANQEQLDLVNRHGGIEVIKDYCKSQY